MEPAQHNMADQDEDKISTLPFTTSTMDPIGGDDLADEEVQDFRFLAALSGYVSSVGMLSLIFLSLPQFSFT